MASNLMGAGKETGKTKKEIESGYIKAANKEAARKSPNGGRGRAL